MRIGVLAENSVPRRRMYPRKGEGAWPFAPHSVTWLATHITEQLNAKQVHNPR